VNEEPYIDSDEEVESIMQALKQNRPAPLAEKPFYFTKRRRQCFRLRDILLDAITPKAPVTNEHIHSTMMPNMNDNNMGHGRQPYFQGVSGMNFPGNPGVDTMFGDSNNPSSASPSFSVR
jgi:hypothetical protein